MKTFRFSLSFSIPFLFAPSPIGSKKGIFLKIIFFIFLTPTVFAQNSKEKAIYDSLTFHYYQNAQWDSVLDIGKEAIHKGHDFYFLRMRMGTAYDVRSNYRLAEIQFLKALKFKPEDANAAFYQYHAALNGGRQDVAYEYYKNYSDIQKQLIRGRIQIDENLKIPVKLKKIEQISFRTGYSFTGNKNNSEEILPAYGDVLLSQTNIRNNQLYGDFSFKGNISENLTWNAAYHYKQINRNYLLRVQNDDLQISDGEIQQHEFFAKLIYWPGNGLSFEGFGQLLSNKNDYYNSEVTFISYHPPISNDSILTPVPNIETTHQVLKNSDWIAGIKIKKTISLLDISVFGTYSQLSELNSWQLGSELTILPKGNYSLYLTNRLLLYSDSLSNRFIYKVIAGGQLTNKIQIKSSATFGDLQNTNEADYGISYNWSEKTTFKAEIGLSYSLSEKVFLSVNYQLFQKRANLNYFVLNGFIENSMGNYLPLYGNASGTYKFNEHFVYLGLVWYL